MLADNKIKIHNLSAFKPFERPHETAHSSNK